MKASIAIELSRSSGSSPPTSSDSINRTCTACGTAKHPDAFYLKRGKVESVCKECKKEQRRGRYQEVRKARSAVPMPTEEAGTPGLLVKRGERPYIEPKQGSDFWDKKYGRALTEEEHREIRFNLLSLLEVLADTESASK